MGEDIQLDKPETIVDYMKKMLAREGVTEYDDAVPDMLVEMFYRYIEDLIQTLKAKQRQGEQIVVTPQIIRDALNILVASWHISTTSSDQLKSLNVNRSIDARQESDIAQNYKFSEPNFHVPIGNRK